MDEIEVFVAIVEANSFAKAAQRLRMPASTVGTKLVKLERRLGVTLVKRTTRQVHVTSSGQAYYRRCLRALAEMGEAERELAAGRDEPTGLLRIAAPSEMAMFLLPRHVEAYLARHPAVRVEMVTTEVPVDRLGKDIDLAVQLEPAPSSKLVARPFRRARLGLWASPGYLDRTGVPKTLDDLSGHSLIRFTRTDGDFAVHPGELEGAIQGKASRLATDDFHSLLGFILSGAGIGLLPDFMGENLPAELPVVQVLEDAAVGAQVRICFVHTARTFVPASVEAFMDQVVGDRSGKAASPNGAEPIADIKAR